jgi:hypothetical protein
MIDGISGAAIAGDAPGAFIFNDMGRIYNFPPALLGAIACRETLRVLSFIDACTFISDDGGHGLMQLTSSYPTDWYLPKENIAWAIERMLRPALDYWNGMCGETGERLILLVAATYNEGLTAAVKYHALGDVDAGTTNRYGHDVRDIYHTLLAHGRFA